MRAPLENNFHLEGKIGIEKPEMDGIAMGFQLRGERYLEERYLEMRFRGGLRIIVLSEKLVVI